MKRLKANRLSHFAYGESFPTEKQKKAKHEHDYKMYCNAKRALDESPFDFEMWIKMEKDLDC